jgi:DNA-binding NarL/FixJ family response regulator
MLVYLFEDDKGTIESICELLEKEIPRVRLERFRTEEAFRSYLDGAGDECPDVAIIDVMVPWTRPSRNMVKPPDDVKEGTWFRAGLRSAKILRDRSASLPIVLYTILDERDLTEYITKLGANTYYVSKNHDESRLVRRVMELLRLPR